jgi:hypothetical protein
VSRPAIGQQDRAALSETSSLRAEGNSNGWINFADGREVVAAVAGPAELHNAFASSPAAPLALAAADLDEDGVPDLISGFSAAGGKGILAVYRGNVDSIYPNTPAARQRKLDGSFTDSPFLSPARLFEVPSAPDFLEMGNFEGDRHQDAVAATRGGNVLYVMDGDGSGGLRPATQIALPGTVTAMASGDVNRADGLKDLVVAIDSDSGPELLVFEGPLGAVRSTPEPISLPTRASSLGIGDLDNDFQTDIAVTAGRDLLIVHGRDRMLSLDQTARQAVAPAVISRVHFKTALQSVTVGRFSADGTVRMAVQSEDGSVSSVAAPSRGGSRYKVVDIMAAGLGVPAHLVRTRVSGMTSDDLIILDRSNHAIRFWMNEDDRRAREALAPLNRAEQRGPATLQVNGEPAAVLPMRLDGSALNGLVVLIAGHRAPSVVPTAGPGQGKMIVVGNPADSGPGTLRQAIIDANAAGGAAITFSLPGSGVPTINLMTPLPTISATMTIDGTSQTPPPGLQSGITPQATNLVELNGQNMILDAFVLQSASSDIKGMVINRSGNAIQLMGSANNNIIEGNFIGTDPTGTSSRANSGRGVLINGGFSNLIGGTARPSINLISANQTGIEMTGAACVKNQVILDNIGSDADGNINPALGNSLNGVSITGGASQNVIGVTGDVVAPGSTANGIKSSGQDGIDIASGSANLVLANAIDKSARNGVTVGSSSNTIGNSRAATINAVWHSGNHGIQVVTATNNLVRGNYLGINFDPSTSAGIDMGNALDGVNLAGGASANMIGGVNPNPATADNPLGNIVAFNHGNGVGLLSGNGNFVQGNFIGTAFNGPALPDLGNLKDGVNITGGATKNIIGASLGALNPNAGNFIAFNHGNGVSVLSGNGNSILSDLIWNNTSGHAISLAAGANDGVTPPRLTSAFPGSTSAAGNSSASRNSITPEASSIVVTGNLTATPNTTMTLEFFLGNACSGPGDESFGFLPTRLGITMVTTDSGGAASFTVTLTLQSGSPSDGFVNASATNPNGSTSSFAQCTAITAAGCNITCPSTVTVMTSASSATVTYSPPVVTGCVASVNCVPASGSVFPAGSTTVTCTATASSGTVSCTFKVLVGMPPVLINPTIQGRKFVTTAAGSNIVTGAVLVDAASGEAWELDDDGAGDWVVFKFTFSTPSGKKFKKFLNQNSGGNVTVFARNPNGLPSGSASLAVP